MQEEQYFGPEHPEQPSVQVRLSCAGEEREGESACLLRATVYVTDGRMKVCIGFVCCVICVFGVCCIEDLSKA